MEKIKALLAQIGATEELQKEICESMARWREEQVAAIREDLKNRLVKAKGICLEEVEDYKRQVARKVEIFLEAQAAGVERSARERSAIEESKAANLLKQAKALLEGIDVGANGDTQAVVEENKKLRESLVAVAEQRDAFKTKADHATDIATKVLHRNRILEGKVAEADGSEPVTESKGKPAEKPAATKLVREQAPAQRSSTQRTIQENQQRPAAQVSGDGDTAIMTIAESLEEGEII